MDNLLSLRKMARGDMLALLRGNAINKSSESCSLETRIEHIRISFDLPDPRIRSNHPRSSYPIQVTTCTQEVMIHTYRKRKKAFDLFALQPHERDFKDNIRTWWYRKLAFGWVQHDA